MDDLGKFFNLVQCWLPRKSSKDSADCNKNLLRLAEIRHEIKNQLILITSTDLSSENTTKEQQTNI